MKTCPACNISKPESDFNKNKSKRDGLQNYCRSCTQERDRIHISKPEIKKKMVERNRFKFEKLLEFKSNFGGSCVCCGEERLHLLDFHHIDPSVKEKTIGNIMRQYGWKKGLDEAKKEAKKCVLLCSNCHRDFHYENKITGITTEQYLETKATLAQRQSS